QRHLQFEDCPPRSVAHPTRALRPPGPACSPPAVALHSLVSKGRLPRRCAGYPSRSDAPFQGTRRQGSRRKRNPFAACPESGPRRPSEFPRPECARFVTAASEPTLRPGECLRPSEIVKATTAPFAARNRPLSSPRSASNREHARLLRRR